MIRIGGACAARVRRPAIDRIARGGEAAANHAREVVEDHEVVVVGHALDDAGERADLDDEPGLLADLARDRLLERLADLDHAAGQGHQPVRRRACTPHHQNLAAPDNGGAHRQKEPSPPTF